MDISLAAAENERATLATARDEANERHQSETYALNLRLEALRSRAATAEQLLDAPGAYGCGGHLHRLRHAW